MKKSKRLTALALAALMCVGVLSGCGSETAADYTLSVCVGEAPATLDPAKVQTVSEETLMDHLYENLMQVASSVSGGTTVENGMARSYDVDENADGTVDYTFHLRRAKWSDGTAVTAADFVYAWQRLADPATDSPNASLLSVVQGYETVRRGGDLSALAVSAKNDTTLVVTLSGKFDWFLSDVCTAPATMPLPSGSDPSVPEGRIGNGPYVLKTSSETSWTLERNPYYYAEGSGPSELDFYFAQTADEAWELYSAGTVDFVGALPETEYAKLASDANRTPVMQLSAEALLFNLQAEPMDNPSVREALSKAVDYAAVCEAAGPTVTAAEALIPTGVPGSEDEDFRSAGGALQGTDAEGYEGRCEEARLALDEAGYDRDTFPAVELVCEDTERDTAVAHSLCTAWRQVLGLSVTVRALTRDELRSVLRSGEYTLALDEVRGLANDAEGFLTQWRSNGENNVTRYSNSAYDTLLAVIDRASDASARQACLHDAESLLLSSYALTPLYHSAAAWRLRESFGGACRDARGFFSFRKVGPAS